MSMLWAVATFWKQVIAVWHAAPAGTHAVNSSMIDGAK